MKKEKERAIKEEEILTHTHTYYMIDCSYGREVVARLHHPAHVETRERGSDHITRSYPRVLIALLCEEKWQTILKKTIHINATFVITAYNL